MEERSEEGGSGCSLTDRCQHVNVSHAKVNSTWIGCYLIPCRRRNYQVEFKKNQPNRPNQANQDPVKNREESPYIREWERERGRDVCAHVYGDAKHRKFFDERKLRIDRPDSDSGSSDRIQIGLPLVSRAKNLNVLLAALKSC